MTMDNEYFRNYYKDHRNHICKRKRKWYKKNAEKVKAANKKYREELLGKRKKSINKTNYSRTTSLKKSYLKRYGKDLNITKDNVTGDSHKIKIVCVDCLDYKTERCPGWDKCEYKEEILEEIKRKGG